MLVRPKGAGAGRPHGFLVHKGFAFDDERRLAVLTFGARRQAGETFGPEKVYVWGATSGFKPKDAEMLKEYARRAIEGGGIRTVGGRAIHFDPTQAAVIVKHWQSELGEPGTES